MVCHENGCKKRAYYGRMYNEKPEFWYYYIQLTKNLDFDISDYHDMIDDLCNFFIKKSFQKIKIILPLPIVAYCGIKGELICNICEFTQALFLAANICQTK